MSTLSTILTIALASASAVAGMVTVFHLNSRSKPVLHWLLDKGRELKAIAYVFGMTHGTNYAVQFADTRGMLSKSTDTDEAYAGFATEEA